MFHSQFLKSVTNLTLLRGALIGDNFITEVVQRSVSKKLYAAFFSGFLLNIIAIIRAINCLYLGLINMKNANYVAIMK